jgi:hypothetical protein
MAKMTPKELKAKISARKTERKAEKVQKYRKMRLVAAKAPEKLEKHLIGLADKFASASEGIENLRENLGLIRAAKQAPLKIRIAAAKNYALKFKKLADEQPEAIANALAEAYNGLNDIAADIEMAAEQMGVDLNESVAPEGMEMESEPMEIAEGEHAVIEEAEEVGLPVPPEVEEHVEEEVGEEKEAAGSDWFSTDRDESGQPKTPEQVDVPRVAAGGGADAWVTDRDEAGGPRAPQKVDIPQAPGEAQTSVNASRRKRGEMLQEVPSGSTSAPAAGEFIEKIPQAEGQAQTPGNKAAKKVTPAGKSATGSL